MSIHVYVCEYVCSLVHRLYHKIIAAGGGSRMSPRILVQYNILRLLFFFKTSAQRHLLPNVADVSAALVSPSLSFAYRRPWGFFREKIWRKCWCSRSFVTLRCNTVFHQSECSRRICDEIKITTFYTNTYMCIFKWVYARHYIKVFLFFF